MGPTYTHLPKLLPRCRNCKLWSASSRYDLEGDWSWSQWSKETNLDWPHYKILQVYHPSNMGHVRTETSATDVRDSALNFKISAELQNNRAPSPVRIQWLFFASLEYTFDSCLIVLASFMTKIHSYFYDDCVAFEISMSCVAFVMDSPGSKMFMNVLNRRIIVEVRSTQFNQRTNITLTYSDLPFILLSPTNDKQLIEYNWYSTSLVRIRWNAGILGALPDADAWVI